jgi:hypothetical protein
MFHSPLPFRVGVSDDHCRNALRKEGYGLEGAIDTIAPANAIDGQQNSRFVDPCRTGEGRADARFMFCDPEPIRMG